MMTDITCRRPIFWQYRAETDVGVVRELNEDAVFAKPEIGLWAVADGMGGHELGDVASQKVIEALDAVPNHERLADLVDAVEDALVQANRAMLDYAEDRFGSATMGSTVAAMAIRGKVGVCLWAGDSRLYRFRRNNLQQMTRDHSQVEEMVQMGMLSAEEAATHPQSNVITRAVGVESALYLDVTVFNTRIGDTFLLCSDGLYAAISDEEIISTLSLRDAEKSARQLIEKSVANGARDNVSVIVVQGLPGKLTQ